MIDYTMNLECFFDKLTITEKTMNQEQRVNTLFDAINLVLGITKQEMQEDHHLAEVQVAKMVLMHLKRITMPMMTDGEFYITHHIRIEVFATEPTRMEGLLLDAARMQYYHLLSNYRLTEDDEQQYKPILNKTA